MSNTPWPRSENTLLWEIQQYSFKFLFCFDRQLQIEKIHIYSWILFRLTHIQLLHYLNHWPGKYLDPRSIKINYDISLILQFKKKQVCSDVTWKHPALHDFFLNPMICVYLTLFFFLKKRLFSWTLTIYQLWPLKLKRIIWLPANSRLCLPTTLKCKDFFSGKEPVRWPGPGIEPTIPSWCRLPDQYIYWRSCPPRIFR